MLSSVGFTGVNTMIISYKHQFIFLKTRKTASSSIQMALSSVCGDEDIIVGDDGPNADRNIDKSFSRNTHVNLKQLKLAISKKKWSTYFKFAFVRNPWDLVVSRYHWEKKGMDCSVAGFRDWLPEYVNSDYVEPERNAQSNIVQAVWERGGGYINDLQSPFILDNGRVEIQFVGHYESLNEDFSAVCNSVGIDTLALPHLKSGFRNSKGYRDLYDSSSKQLVENAFATDIDHFGYQF
ncbi:hypothetical protein MNBD_GAMMA12-216 [hydrothermal vent metagenome]|uniref:Sulfotransferase family protein n=1 Tax=hydrothermal vent metagenome TaxID=652676 RepID=A0A3B0Y1H6_9ZZZZ